MPIRAAAALLKRLGPFEPMSKTFNGFRRLPLTGRCPVSALRNEPHPAELRALIKSQFYRNHSAGAKTCCGSPPQKALPLRGPFEPMPKTFNGFHRSSLTGQCPVSASRIEPHPAELRVLVGRRF